MRVCEILSKKGYCTVRQCAILCNKACEILDLLKQIRSEHNLKLNEAIEYAKNNNLIK